MNKTMKIEGMMCAHCTGRVEKALSAIDGVSVAGKTGTHERGDGDDDSWFVGMAPADDPKVVVAVAIERGESGAGASAAHDVMKTALEVTGAL